MRKTKIVCTLGPATDNYQTLKRLVKAGMNVARINMSHGSYEEHVSKWCERLAKSWGRRLP